MTALLIAAAPQTQAQFGGRATHGSQGGARNFQISMPQLRMLIREVVREVAREANSHRPQTSTGVTEKTIDQLTSTVERRLALRAPLRVVRESTELNRGSHGVETGERKPWERQSFVERNSESNRRRIEEHRRKQNELAGETGLMHRRQTQTTLYHRPTPSPTPVRPHFPGGGTTSTNTPPVVPPPAPPPRPNPGGGNNEGGNNEGGNNGGGNNGGGGQVGIGGGPGPVPPTFPTNPGIGIGMPAPGTGGGGEGGGTPGEGGGTPPGNPNEGGGENGGPGIQIEPPVVEPPVLIGGSGGPEAPPTGGEGEGGGATE